MIFNTKIIIGRRVETRSGEAIGKVASFDIELETGHLHVMHVKHGGLVAGLVSEELLVPASAILEITKECVVIADGIVKERVLAALRVDSSRTPSASGAAMREQV
jgi:sporulation protein YlmC with PRC-barrel domain